MTPNEYRQREGDRQRGLYDQRCSDRERFAEIQTIAAPPTSPLSIVQQQIAQMDLLLAELSAVRERALQAKAEGDAKLRDQGREADFGIVEDLRQFVSE
jgi:hypothetical protein